MKYLITFAATGGMTIEADSKEKALEIFNQADNQKKAAQELASNGIDVTDISEEED